MPEVTLRGKAGVPQTKQEGNTIVVKKNIVNAVLEERIPARKLKGKQAQLAVFSKAELDSRVAAAKSETADLVHKNARELMADSEKTSETSRKKLAEKARHMKGKVAAAKKATQTAKTATQTAKAAAVQVEVDMNALANQMGVELEKKFAEQKQHMKGKVVAAKKATQTAKDAAKAEIKKVKARSVNDTGKAITLNEDLLKTTEKQETTLKRIRKERDDYKTLANAKETPATPAASSRAPGTPTSRAPLTPAQRGRSRTPAR